MIARDILYALGAALLLTAVFAYGYCKLRGGDRLLFFFVILFLGTWAGGVWVARFGPLVYGVAWLSFMIVGFFLALLLVSLLYRDNPCRILARRASLPGEKAHVGLFSLFFWVLLGVLALAIAAAYLF